MAEKSDYAFQQEAILNKKIEHIEKMLPPVCSEYFSHLKLSKTPKTVYAYATDIKLFFSFLCQDVFCIEMERINIYMLKEVTAKDISHFLIKMHNGYGDNDENGLKKYRNGDRTLSRKLSSIKSFFHYCYLYGYLPYDVSSIVETPTKRRKNKNVIRLTEEENEMLLNVILYGENYSNNVVSSRQKKFAEKTRKRDYAIIVTLLGTGIRVSELVGIDINDINFKDMSIRVFRKGAFFDTVYFGDEVNDALLIYLDERKNIEPMAGSEQALFLSLRKKRIDVRSVEKLVKKYNLLTGNAKNITPHKLRSTFGTLTYEQTKDIMLTKNAMGHADIKTTEIYMDNANVQDRKNAAKNLILTKDLKTDE